MLKVEDGMLIDNANTYADLACADEYCVPRGLWPATGIEVDTEAGTETPDASIVEAKEAALIRAFDYLNTLQWLGSQLDWEQAGAWPRKNVPIPGNNNEFVAEDCVPRLVVQAQLELAALIYGGEDLFKPLERGGRVTSESHSFKEGNIDVIGGDSNSDSYTYSESAPVETFYPSVFGLIAPLLAVVPGDASFSAVLEAGRG